MRRLVLALALGLAPAMAAAVGGAKLDEVDIDLSNKAALQRGAKYFANYCLSCHSAAYARYKGVGDDLGLTKDQVERNLIFDDSKVGETMTVAMSDKAAEDWFGAPPPDLSLVARSRGPDWLYTYLRSFYLDDSRPMGVNNLVFPNVGMPHVLWQLQGWQRLVEETKVDEDGHEHTVKHLELVKEGSMTSAEYDRMVRDLVTFLTYLGEPAKLERRELGVYVLLFLAVLFVVAYLLKKEYWRDIH